MRGGPRIDTKLTWPCANERRMSRARRTKIFKQAWKADPAQAIVWDPDGTNTTGLISTAPAVYAGLYFVPPCGLWLVMADVVLSRPSENSNSNWYYRVFTRTGYQDIPEDRGAPERLYQAALLALSDGYARRSLQDAVRIIQQRRASEAALATLAEVV